ncbi:PREDICTED: leucine-rich repeat-containing G-protein coupled receptor 5-like [Papilio polytes]|uniref:leucine-rich repeat-containing G-protein coupled receptor 5-like n=1 Tax=Papilio polytes TaxID=76194 RepID=UPI000675F8D1|nr:PREDICTED: leucine-rich repeat-containing G-protein coupled receptor 5-like [Papilio polytes]
MTFRGAENLRSLDLGYNHIVVINSSFLGFAKLQQLSLRNNFIDNISYDDLKNLNNIEKESFDETVCLDTIYLSGNNLKNIPNDLFESRNISQITLNNNILEGSLSRGMFSGLNGINKLEISHQNLVAIEDFAFYGLNKLEILLLNNNSINNMSKNSFKLLNNVKQIDLSYNNIKDFDFDKNIDVSFSEIPEVNGYSFNHMNRLQNINMSHCGITSLYSKAFSGTGLQLDTLRNNLTFGSEKRCQLRELVVSNARLENPNKLNISKLRFLSNLVLSHNEIRYINKDFLSNVYRIQEIDLSYNRIEYIQPGALKNKVHLKTLNLSHNFLTGFKYGAFRGLVRLNVLDLSYNQIVRYQKEILEEAEHLDVLILDNNRIPYINYSEFSETSLSKLSIGNNSIPCKEISLLLLVDYVDVVGQNVDEYEENVNGIICGTK